MVWRTMCRRSDSGPRHRALLPGFSWRCPFSGTRGIGAFPRKRC